MMTDNASFRHQQHRPSQRITVEELVGRDIVTADGKHVGHVVEIRVSPGPDYRIVELQFGRYGWLDRLNVLRLIHGKYRPIAAPERIPWDAVATFERSTITLKPGYDQQTHPA